MPEVKRPGDNSKYYVVSLDCLGCKCFAPGHYQHRGASGGGNGTHATGAVSPCCLTNAYHGCPSESGKAKSLDLLKDRKALGWKKA
jgi:hypothetical protein